MVGLLVVLFTLYCTAQAGTWSQFLLSTDCTGANDTIPFNSGECTTGKTLLTPSFLFESFTCSNNGTITLSASCQTGCSSGCLTDVSLVDGVCKSIGLGTVSIGVIATCQSTAPSSSNMFQKQLGPLLLWQWLIIAAAVLLLLICACVICCCISRRRRRGDRA